MRGLTFLDVPERPTDRFERQYQAFILGHVEGHAGWWPHRGRQGSNLKWWVRKEHAKPDCRAIVAVAETDHLAIAGCAIVRPGLIVYAYVKEDGLRRRGLARAMLDSLGVDPSVPHGVTIWTPDASRVAAAGKYRIYPALPPPPPERPKETECPQETENPKA